MRKYLTTAMAIALMSGVSYADLQNVEVGGEIRTRGNSYYDVGGDESNGHSQFTEQRTAVSIDADFSDEVSANVTFSNYSIWGDNWYSYDTQTELDDFNNSLRGNAVEINEAYIHLGDAIAGFDLKIGRQEVQFGSEFLVGNEDTAGGYTHRAFDGIRGDWSNDSFDVTLFNFKAEEDDFNSSEKDEDADFYGAYVTYNGLEDHTIEGYVMEYREGDDNDDNDELLTIGARATGVFGNFDYELEIATQSGDDGDDTDYEGDAINAELGYTFDTDMQPRVFLGYASFSGADDSDEYEFNRLYSDWEYSEFLGDGDISNADIIRLGVSANVTEKIGLSLVVSDFELDEESDGLSNESVSTTGSDDDLGTEVGLYATYQYSEDVAVEVGYATLMLGDAIEDAVDPDDEDPTYIYAEISLSF